MVLVLHWFLYLIQCRLNVCRTHWQLFKTTGTIFQKFFQWTGVPRVVGSSPTPRTNTFLPNVTLKVIYVITSIFVTFTHYKRIEVQCQSCEWKSSGSKQKFLDFYIIFFAHARKHGESSRITYCSVWSSVNSKWLFEWSLSLLLLEFNEMFIIAFNSMYTNNYINERYWITLADPGGGGTPPLTAEDLWFLMPKTLIFLIQHSTLSMIFYPPPPCWQSPRPPPLRSNRGSATELNKGLRIMIFKSKLSNGYNLLQGQYWVASLETKIDQSCSGKWQSMLNWKSREIYNVITGFAF